MPFVVAAIKLTLFALWARPTYEMTVRMLEMRERRHGILPAEETGEEAAAKVRTTGRPSNASPSGDGGASPGSLRNRASSGNLRRAPDAASQQPRNRT